MSNPEVTAKIKLAALMNEIQPIIDKHISNLAPLEVEYILTNFRKYLKIDIERDLEKIRNNNLTTSPFDDILGGL